MFLLFKGGIFRVPFHLPGCVSSFLVLEAVLNKKLQSTALKDVFLSLFPGCQLGCNMLPGKLEGTGYDVCEYINDWSYMNSLQTNKI